jgi:hypothetical protein
MVVRYSFLWSREAAAGETEGRKDRPCVIITAIGRATDGRLRVRVLPVTHRPTERSRSIALPPKVKRHLGLDADASWIVLDGPMNFFGPGWTSPGLAVEARGMDLWRPPDGNLRRDPNQTPHAVS